MGTVKELAAKVASLEKGNHPEPDVDMQAIADLFLPDAMDEMVDAVKAAPDEAWDVLRNGSDAEFAALVNRIAECGREFDNDSGCRKIIAIARSRGTITAAGAVQYAFPNRFDHFWNEAEPTAKARTFNQALPPTVAV